MVVEQLLGLPFPQDPGEQPYGAIAAVFDSSFGTNDLPNTAAQAALLAHDDDCERISRGRFAPFAVDVVAPA